MGMDGFFEDGGYFRVSSEPFSPTENNTLGVLSLPTETRVNAAKLLRQSLDECAADGKSFLAAPRRLRQAIAMIPKAAQGGFNGGPFESGDVGLRLIGRDGLWHSRRLCCAARGFFADA